MYACSINLSRMILDVPGLPGRSGETIVMLTEARSALLSMNGIANAWVLLVEILR